VPPLWDVAVVNWTILFS